jgi:hypothetical protein
VSSCLKDMSLFPRLLVVWVTLVALPVSAQPSDELGWSRIKTREGASVDFPGFLFTKQVSTDEQTIRYTTADGRGIFSLFSIPNTRHESPAQFVRHADKGADKFDYKRVTSKFLAASTIRNSQVIYRRCNFAGDMIHCVDMRYPYAETRAWDAAVTRVSLSLRPR